MEKPLEGTRINRKDKHLAVCGWVYSVLCGPRLMLVVLPSHSPLYFLRTDPPGSACPEITKAPLAVPGSMYRCCGLNVVPCAFLVST